MMQMDEMLREMFTYYSRHPLEHWFPDGFWNRNNELVSSTTKNCYLRHKTPDERLNTRTNQSMKETLI